MAPHRFGDNRTGGLYRRRGGPNRIEVRPSRCLETRQPNGCDLHEGQASCDTRTGKPGLEAECFTMGHYMDI